MGPERYSVQVRLQPEPTRATGSLHMAPLLGQET